MARSKGTCYNPTFSSGQQSISTQELSKERNCHVQAHESNCKDSSDRAKFMKPPLKPLPCKERSLTKYTWVFECRLQKTASKKKSLSWIHHLTTYRKLGWRRCSSCHSRWMVPEKDNLLEQDRWWEPDPSWYLPVHKNPHSLRVNSSFLFLYIKDKYCGIVRQMHPNH